MNKRHSYPCPVCGYQHNHWSEPAEAISYSFDICPCCGVEFGYNDAGRTHEELRSRWVAGGMKWFSRVTPAPADWNPRAQLGFDVVEPQPHERRGEG
jgi:hypothetical protein